MSPKKSVPVRTPEQYHEVLRELAGESRKGPGTSSPDPKPTATTAPAPLKPAARVAAAKPAPPPLVHADAEAEPEWIVLQIKGMTCKSCENRIRRKLTRLDGVTSVKVSAVRGTAEVFGDPLPDYEEMEAAVTSAGYAIGRDRRPWLTDEPRVWGEAVVALFAVGMLALILKSAGGLPSAGNFKSGGVLVVMVVGLTAGVSTCMAMVGGLVLAASASFNAAHPDAGGAARFRPQVAFNIGRIVGFAALGGILGAVGGSFRLTGPTLGWIMLMVAGLMLVLGLRLTDLSPRMAAWSLALPSGIATRLGMEERAGGRYSDLRTALLGAGSFFLPCGFTQTVQVYALSTASSPRAAMIMGAFALGTAPGLLGIGGLAAAARGRAGQVFTRFAGVAVIGLAFVNVNGAVANLGWKTVGGVASAETLTPNVTIVDGVQVVHTKQTAAGYTPSKTVVYRGMPVRWEVTSTAPFSCSASLYAPGIADGRSLKSGLNTFDFTPARDGVIRYQCSMGMYGGTIKVVDPPPPTTAVTGGTAVTPNSTP